MDTKNQQDTKPAATSVANNASTPGAVHVDASSVKGQQALQKTKGSSGGPKYCPEGNQKQTSGLEHDSVSSKRAIGQWHDDKKVKQHGKSKKIDVVDSADEKLTKSGTTRSQRQENRRARILSRTLPEDANLPSVHDQDEDQDGQDQDDEDVAPGAVRVPGVDSAGRGDEEDELTKPLTIVGATDLQHETSALVSTRTIVEAKLVEENEREQMEEELRQKLEEELRQKIHEEQMGQVAQADIVEDDSTSTRRRALLGTGIVVILFAIILGTVFGTTNTSRNAESVTETKAPTGAPLNSLCEEAHMIGLGDAAIEASLQNAIEQVVVSCEFPEQRSDSKPGLWCKVRG